MPTDKINYSLEYSLNDALSVYLFHLNNQRTGIQFNVSADPAGQTGGDYLEEIAEPFYSIPFPKTSYNKMWSNIENDLEDLNIKVLGNKLNKDEAVVVINNLSFPSQTKAIGRTLRVMSKYVPLY